MPRKYTLSEKEKARRSELGKLMGLKSKESGHMDRMTEKSLARRKRAMELLKEKELLELSS